MKNKIITNNMLDELRMHAGKTLSVSRFNHTVGVEETAAILGAKLCPAKIQELRAAALLHDITKEYSLEKQLKICREFGIILRNDEARAPAVVHAITAAAIIPSQYPEFNTEEIISAVRWHTTGCTDMSIFDKIICISDYIEPNRKYKECRKIGDTLENIFNKETDIITLEKILNYSLLCSFENTVFHIKKMGLITIKETTDAINSLKNTYT